MTRKIFSLFILLSVLINAKAQLLVPKESFTKADTLRGSNNEYRDWWDVLKYDIAVTPDYKTKTIRGTCFLKFLILKDGDSMQIDLQDSLIIDSIEIYNFYDSHRPNRSHKVNNALHFLKHDGYYFIFMPHYGAGTTYMLEINYHGKPREAVKPPWDGGWIWTKDSLGNPWMSVACQGLGASSWFPCKDLQSDKPDSGAALW